MQRRRFVIATAALGLGLARADLSFAQGRAGGLSVQLDDARALAGLSGEDLRRGLLRNLRLVAETRDMVPARLYAMRVADGAVADAFVSRRFELRPGRGARPDERHFPGEMSFPGEMTFPGEMSFPGEMGVPDRDPMALAERMAVETLRARRQDQGFFFVVFTPEPEVWGQGIALGTVRA